VATPLSNAMLLEVEDVWGAIGTVWQVALAVVSVVYPALFAPLVRSLVDSRAPMLPLAGQPVAVRSVRLVQSYVAWGPWWALTLGCVESVP
jgi:hypothetical protein